MDQVKTLSGTELVAKGVTKLDASLPEIGLKDVIPNGSWLEQKQVQSALEGKKHLLDVERIDKIGSLSHAIWHDNLKLAEVTKIAGGHWQYLGHNVGKTKLLYPEEILFLMENNSLLLTHNEVTVSLQKAYALLLNTQTTLTQYKVYSSLSRIGYKILRHKGPKMNNGQSPHVSKTDSELNKSGENKESKHDMVIDSIVDSNTSIENSNEKIQESKSNENVSDKENDKEEAEFDGLIKKEDQNVTTDKALLSMEVDDGRSKTDTPITGDEVNKEVGTVCSTNVGSNIVQTSTAKEEFTNTETNSADSSEKGVEGHNEKSIASETSITGESDTQMTEENCDLKKVIETVLTSQESESNEHVPMNIDEQNIEDVIQIEDDESTQESLILTTPSEENHIINGYMSRLTQLPMRKLKPCDSNSLHKNFENVPDLFKKELITLNVPDQEYLPKNIFVNKNTYTLNLQNIKKKTCRSMSYDSAPYTSSDEANGTHIRRIRSSSSCELSQNPFITNEQTYRRPPRPFFFRPAPFWRPQNNLNYFQFSMFFQRPSYPNMFMHSRFHYQPRPNLFLRPVSYPSNINPSTPNSDNKRMRNGRNTHLRNIKMLAYRLKQLIQSGSLQTQSVAALKSLLQSYNYRYKSKLRLTENVDIFDDETVIETIELDDEEESRRKRPRLEDDDDDLFNKNLEQLKQLAIKLRQLEDKQKATARHRRAFSNAIKTFNNSFNADVYLNSEYEIIDRKLITIDTSSESECVEDTKKVRKTKKLRNPFNILKRMSQKFNLKPDTNSDDKAPGVNDMALNDSEQTSNKYNEHITKVFDKNWLPNEDDFGRAEIVPKHLMNSRIIDSNKELFLFDFMNEQFQEYDNWLEAKSCFLRHIEETNFAIQKQQEELLSKSNLTDSELKPILHCEDCSNMPLVLEKLRIIENDKDIATESSLKIDFDVYNRDVQNFKKTNPPKPHFRIICVEESSSFPTATDIRGLQSKYDDNVAMVFAIVGTGSISYLQVNPIDMSIYIPNNDLT